MGDAAYEFCDAMRAAGLQPPAPIVPGKLYRFPGVDKSSGNTAGWCKLFPDGLGGCFGDWSTGLSEHWQAKRERPFSTEERDAFRRRVAEASAAATSERDTRHDAAAHKAQAVWNDASTEAGAHPYLARKRIAAHGTRLYKGRLLVPMYDGERLCSLQLIAEDGEKRFLSGGRVAGCSFLLGESDAPPVLCIAEGFATGATLHEATGCAVVIAFTAGNLAAVARATRDRFPLAKLILCADDDIRTQGNPGRTKAREAAEMVGGLLAIPDFGADRPTDATDFNDMAALRGLDAVRRAIEGAMPVKTASPPVTGSALVWQELLPLAAKVQGEPYPLDALPDVIRDAVEEVRGFVKAPVAMVASSALAALAVAIQAYVDARRAEKLAGPVSLFLLTIADSGERKSTCDGFFMKAIREYEAAQAEAARPLVTDYNADVEAWDAKRSGIKEKIRQLAKDGKETSILEATLRDLEHDKPEPPRIPRLLYADATPEALAYNLAKGWPSAAVVSSEAGVVFGSHGMGKDSMMRDMASKNVLWDGGTLPIDRRSGESFAVRGARLSVALQVQEPTLRAFFDRTGGLARGTGFLARFLVAWPESTQGFRLFSEAPAQWPALAQFNRRIAAILAAPAPVDDSGSLSPTEMMLTAEAKRAWVTYHDEIEKSLASGGELYDVRDVASKSADNAVRLAALFQYFSHGCGAIEIDAMEAGCRIAAWHLNEARRFYGELALPAELADAARLDGWLGEWCRRQGTDRIARRDVQRNVTPIHLRQTTALDIALKELVAAGRVVQVTEGRRKEIVVNPSLLGVRSDA